jgi:hypothetical protein
MFFLYRKIVSLSLGFFFIYPITVLADDSVEELPVHDAGCWEAGFAPSQNVLC